MLTSIVATIATVGVLCQDDDRAPGIEPVVAVLAAAMVDTAASNADQLWQSLSEAQRAAVRLEAGAFDDALARLRASGSQSGWLARCRLESFAAMALSHVGRGRSAHEALADFVDLAPASFRGVTFASDEIEHETRFWAANCWITLARFERYLQNIGRTEELLDRVRVECPLMSADASAVMLGMLVDFGLEDSRSDLVVELREVATLSDGFPAVRALVSYYTAQDDTEMALELLDRYLASGASQMRTEFSVDRAIVQYLHSSRRKLGVEEARAALEQCLLLELPDELRVLVQLHLLDIATSSSDWPRAVTAAETLLADRWPQMGRILQGQVEAAVSRFLRRAEADDSAKVVDYERQRDRHDGLLEDMLQAWLRLPVREGGLGFLRYRTRREVVVERLLLERGEQAAETAANRLLGLLSATTWARSEKAPAIDVAVLREGYLAPRHGLLLVLPGRESSVAITIDIDDVGRYELAAARDLVEPVRRLLRALRMGVHGKSDRGREHHERELLGAAGDAARNLLTSSVRDAIDDWDLVTIIDFGALSGLPWEALAWGPDELFGERFGVVNSACLPVELGRLAVGSDRAIRRDGATLWLRATLSGHVRAAAERDDRALRPDDFEDALRPLGARVSLELGDSVTVASLAAHPPTATINHLVAHGAVASEHERDGGLALAPTAESDGFLGCEAILALHGRVSGLVVLSACGTAIGRSRIGDDQARSTPGGAFLRAGAETVVHSGARLWLPDQLQAAGQLYAALLVGDSPALAMREVRRQQREATWLRFQRAQMQVLGLGHRPVVLP